MARRTDQEIAEAIVDDVIDNGPGSAREIADSVEISLSRFYAVMVREVNEAAERKNPGHRIMPPRKGEPYAFVRKFREVDPTTVTARAAQAASKNHRVAQELDVLDAGPRQRELAVAAQGLAAQSEFFASKVREWANNGAE